MTRETRKSRPPYHPEATKSLVRDRQTSPERSRLIEGAHSATIERWLEDGTRFRVVKVPYSAAALERRLRELGWAVEIHETAGPFYWAAGTRS